MKILLAFQGVRILERLLFVCGKAAFNLSYVLCGWQAFGTNASIEKGCADGLVVGDVFVGNLRLAGHFVGAGVVDGDLGGEILGLEDDGGSEVSERAAVGHLPLGLHSLGAPAE